MATPRPAGWKGGSESFGFLRTFDGHISTDRVGSMVDDEDGKFGFANVRWGFDEADIGGDYECVRDVHCDDKGSA